MVKSFIPATLVLCVFSALPMLSAQAQTTIPWDDANDIASGEPIRASGILEIKAEVENLRSELDAGAGNDNLGNHTATAFLNMTNQAITSDVGILRDPNGGWVQTYGKTGWFNGTYGGGWTMIDSTWLRAYGNKSIITYGNIRGARFEDASNSGYFVDPAGRSQIVNMDMNDYIRHRGDTNTHIGFSGNDTIRLRTSGVDRLSVMSSGNVGIGKTWPTEKLDVDGNIQAGNWSGAVALTTNDGGGDANVTFNHTARTPDSTGNAGRIHVNVDSTTNGAMVFELADNLAQGVAFSTAEILRLQSNGRVGIGTESPQAPLHVEGVEGRALYVYNTMNTSFADGIDIRLNRINPTGNNGFLIFRDRDNSVIGHVRGNGVGGVTFDQTSDARLKENVTDTKYDLSDLMQIKVRDFNYLTAPGKTTTGLIAQELNDIYPVAVSVGGEDPQQEPWSVSYGDLTPLLIQGIQELKTEMDTNRAVLEMENEALKARIAVLEKNDS